MSRFIVVGAGIFGATVAERLAAAGRQVLIIDRRPHLAGNIYSYTDSATGIEVHQYGSHIFHTTSDQVWRYITQFADFNNYVHTVNTRHHNALYPMPINLDTINKLYGQKFTAKEAEHFLESEKVQLKNPQNFEEKALSLVGKKLYEAFLKNYTKKQWHEDPKNLSAEILNRIPVRFSHDSRYFLDAKHQGIPKSGYAKLVENMLKNPNIELSLNTSFKDLQISSVDKIIYCGQIDELLDYEFGVLPYRSLKFETERVKNSAQQSAVINEADLEIPYTRTHNYKYYQVHQPAIIQQEASIICREYPADYQKGGEAYYPINNPESEQLYQKYVKRAREKIPNLILGGRLGAYRYWDMDVAVKNALELADKLK